MLCSAAEMLASNLKFDRVRFGDGMDEICSMISRLFWGQKVVQDDFHGIGFVGVGPLSGEVCRNRELSLTRRSLVDVGS